jgi:tRNA nucleotidyltransferase (CCA-adding enzyme)
MPAHWEHYPHGADIGVRGVGATPEEAFEQAAVALGAVVADVAAVEPRCNISIDCEGKDLELLLVEWLNALICQMAERRMLFSRFEVRLQDAHLRAQAWGEPVDRERHQPAVEPKGATCTTLCVARVNDEWIAQTIVDV